MYRCTANGITITFMPCLHIGSKGYNCFCTVITTRLASNSFACFANCASFLQHCHAVTVDCGLMDIRTDRLFLSGYKFPLAFPSTLCTTPT